MELTPPEPKKTKKPKPHVEVDPRLVKFKDYAYETFYIDRGVHLVLGGAEMGALKTFLNKTKKMPEYDLEHLQDYWMCFLRSRRPFDREALHPLRYFLGGIERFAAECVKMRPKAKISSPELEKAREELRANDLERRQAEWDAGFKEHVHNSKCQHGGHCIFIDGKRPE